MATPFMIQSVAHKDLLICSTGTVSYDSAWRWQQELRERRRVGDLPDILLLLDHPPTYTLGRSTKAEHVIGDVGKTGISVHEIERGGSVAYHGPGQIVGYPIIDLRHRGRDIHKYIRDLEEVLILTLANFGLESHRCSGLTGVWLGNQKIAAIGVHVRHWITMHGFALNVSTSLDPYRDIKPCGLESEVMISMEKLLGRKTPKPEQIRDEITRQFESVFHCCSKTIEPDSLIRMLKFAK